MNVFLFIVNYRVDDHLVRFIQSVAAAQAACPSVHVDVHVLDNSQKSDLELGRLRERVAIGEIPVTLYSTGTNHGYFSGIGLAQSLLPKQTDCVIYCNPDLLLDPDFLEILHRTIRGQSGVLAPAILSLQDGIDQNPKYRQRLTSTKLRCLQRIFSFRHSYVVYSVLGRFKEVARGWYRHSRPNVIAPGPIYAAHGAMFVFADVDFFRRLPPFPCFLFGEELFVAEEARLAGVPVVYVPSLRVRDARHASISQLAPEFKRSLLWKSVTFILERYYARAEHVKNDGRF